MNFNKSIFLILTFLLLTGLFVRIFISAKLPLTSDEGSYLYDGFLITKGNIPFRDFFARSPLLLSEIALSIIVFGQNIFAGRFLSIISALLSGILIYFIGKKLLNKTFGALAASLFFLLPEVVFQTVHIHTQSNEILFVAGAVLCLLLSIEKQKNIYSLGSGILIGLSFFIRQSVLLYLFAFIVYIFFQKSGFKKNFLYALSLIVGFLIITIPGILVLIKLAGFEKIWLTMGPSLIFSLQRGSGVIGTFSINVLESKISSLNTIARESLLSITLFLTFVWILIFQKKKLLHLRNRGYLLIFLLLIFMGSGYFLYSAFDPNYFAEFLIPLVLISSVSLIILFQEKKFILPLILLIAVLALLSYYYGFNFPHTGQYSQKNIKEALRHMKENGAENDEILTSALIIPYLSGRNAILKISHPTIYRYGRIMEADRDILVPSLGQIEKYMEENKTKFVVIDQNFRNTYFKFHEVFENYVMENYERKKVIKPKNPFQKLLAIEIWGRKETVIPSKAE